MISSWAHLVTKLQSWKQVGAEMRDKKGLTGGKRVEREVEKMQLKLNQYFFNNKSVLAQNNEEQKNLMNNNRQHQESNLCYLSLRGIFLTRRICALAIHHFLTLIWLFLYHCRTANSKKWIIFFTLQRSRTLDRDQTRKSEVVFFLSDRFVLKAQLGKVFIRCSSILRLGRVL